MKKMGIAIYATGFAEYHLKQRRTQEPKLTPEEEETYKSWVACVFINSADYLDHTAWALLSC